MCSVCSGVYQVYIYKYYLLFNNIIIIYTNELQFCRYKRYTNTGYDVVMPELTIKRYASIAYGGIK